MTYAETDKPFKQQEHQRARANYRSRQDDPHEKEFGNPWSSAKDGKRRFDPVKWPKLLRK